MKGEKYMVKHGVEILKDSPIVEVTPNNIRIRKKILNTDERKKFDARKMGK